VDAKTMHEQKLEGLPTRLPQAIKLDHQLKTHMP